jgi:hypothetical protein
MSPHRSTSCLVTQNKAKNTKKSRNVSTEVGDSLQSTSAVPLPDTQQQTEEEGMQRMRDAALDQKTIKNYEGQVKRFKEWAAKEKAVNVDMIRPGLDNVIANYLFQKCDEEQGEGKGKSTAELIFSALKWYYGKKHPKKNFEGLIYLCVCMPFS